MRIKILSWIVALGGVLLFVLRVLAFANDPNELIKKADYYASLYNWVEAGPLFAQAEKLFAGVRDKRNELYARLGRIRGTMETLNLPQTSLDLAAILEDPLVQGDNRLRLQCLLVKGDIDHEIDPAAARKDWEEVQALAKKLGDKKWENRASGELGFIAFLDGDTGSAQKLVGTALMVAKFSGDTGAELRYMTAVGTGLVLAGYKQEALPYLDGALQLAEKNPDTGFPFLTYWGKVKALSSLGQREEAEKLADIALNQARASGKKVKEAQMLVTRGKLSMDASKDDEAIDLFQQSIALSEAGGFSRLLAEAQLNLSEINRKRGDLEQAESFGNAAFRNSQTAGDIYFLPSQLSNLAQLKVQRGQFAEAEELYALAADVVEGVLVNVPSIQAKSALISAMSNIYVAHFALALNQLKNPEKAFHILEAARGRTIADIIRGSPLKQSTPRSFEGARAVEREISQLQILLPTVNKPSERKELLDKLFIAEQSLAQTPDHTNRLLKTKTRSQPVPLKTLQRGLKADELVLEYVLSDPESTCLVVSRDQVKAVTLPGRKEIEDLVDRYLVDLKSKKEALNTGKQLYEALLGAVPKPLRQRLIVVPDGKLHLLPFDALVNPQGRYALDTHSITYAPSATVYHLLRTASMQASTPLPYLGVGDIPYGKDLAKSPGGKPVQQAGITRGIYDLQNSPLNPLIASRDEVLAAATITGEKSVVLLDEEATESAFKAQPLEKYGVLHLAVHGISNAKMPDRAALVLLSDPSSNEDGLLQAREISGLNLNAKMVVLSACDTAVGRLQGQEGVANLARAFLFAGAKTVVATLWSVDDEFSVTLMKRFYRNLAAGQDKAAALRNAKRAILTEFGEKAVPYYWAGFSLIGQGDATITASDSSQARRATR
jgi:CHAT domain-containing protein